MYQGTCQVSVDAYVKVKTKREASRRSVYTDQVDTRHKSDRDSSHDECNPIDVQLSGSIDPFAVSVSDDHSVQVSPVGYHHAAFQLIFGGRCLKMRVRVAPGPVVPSLPPRALVVWSELGHRIIVLALIRSRSEFGLGVVRHVVPEVVKGRG